MGLVSLWRQIGLSYLNREDSKNPGREVAFEVAEIEVRMPFLQPNRARANLRGASFRR